MFLQLWCQSKALLRFVKISKLCPLSSECHNSGYSSRGMWWVKCLYGVKHCLDFLIYGVPFFFLDWHRVSVCVVVKGKDLGSAVNSHQLPWAYTDSSIYIHKHHFRYLPVAEFAPAREQSQISSPKFLWSLTWWQQKMGAWCLCVRWYLIPKPAAPLLIEELRAAKESRLLGFSPLPDMLRRNR